jgi:hypothetical protein
MTFLNTISIDEIYTKTLDALRAGVSLATIHDFLMEFERTEQYERCEQIHRAMQDYLERY